jgi:hypothetical protein
MALILDGTNGLSDVDGSAATPAIRGSDANTGIFFPAADTIAFAEGGVESMRLDSNGNVGIGTSSPNSYAGYTTLTLNGTSGSLLDFEVNGTHTGEVYADGTSVFGIQAMGERALNFKTNNTERARIDSSGNLLVGTTSSLQASVSNTLQVKGAASTNIAYFQVSTNGQSIVFRNASNVTSGTITIDASNTTYATSSDYRLKHDIQPMQNALATVAQLRPVTYKWNADDSESQGFIAHELQEVVPECVTGEKDAVDADGNPQYQGIDTSFLVATLTAAIQEQQAIITALTARVEAQEVRLTSLEGAQA